MKRKVVEDNLDSALEHLRIIDNLLEDVRKDIARVLLSVERNQS